MNHRLTSFAVALAAVLCAGTAAAQTHLIKMGVTRYTTHAQTNGVTGIGIPPGADAETGDATTAILVYERLVNPNLGIELVVGIPPRIEARATGSVAFLGDDILSAKVLTPSLLANYHFGARGDTWRPYVGAGINYTRFESIRSRLAEDVEMSDSVGWIVQTGVDYALNKNWSLFASVAAIKVKSKLVASGTTVLQSTINFRPVVYNAGVGYWF
jgi:outer membrane protein